VTRLVVFAAVALALLPGVAGATPHVDVEAEHEALTRINRERAALGLAALRVDESLSRLARFHSADMALGGFVTSVSPRSGSLEERALAAAGLSERSRVLTHVAAGTEAASGTLTRLIVDPAATRVGLGVVTDGDGRLFLTEVAVSDPVQAPPSLVVVARPSRIAAFLSLVERNLVRVPSRWASR
jgi:hypothetical protein